MQCRSILLSVLAVTAFWANLNPTAADDATPAKVDALNASSAPQLVLPPVIHSVVGIEANLYFDNVCLVINPDNYVFDVNCTAGWQLADHWTLVPTAKQIGDHALSISIRDQSNAILAEAQTVLRVVPADAAADTALSLLCVGDSLTHASIYPKSILDLCQPTGNPQLTLVGSHTPTGNSPSIRHEGYGGWTAERFATHFTGTARTGEYAKRGSPFLYAQPNQSPRLDFKQYCQDVNGGKTPDAVTIFLGPNDIFSYQDDTLEAGLERIFKHFDQLVQMIRTDSPATRIGIMLPVPPAASQDAFGANYANGQTRWQYKRNQHRMVSKLIEIYGQRSADNIDVVATHVNLDCRHNYPAQPVPANSRSMELTPRQNNGVHPAPTGYQQIGDSVYCWLKATSGK